LNLARINHLIYAAAAAVMTEDIHRTGRYKSGILSQKNAVE
jgi:hypothetical protein